MSMEATRVTACAVLEACATEAWTALSNLADMQGFPRWKALTVGERCRIPN
jgi:hypothetical protein